MKNIFFYFLAFAFLFTACGEDDTPTSTAAFSYDGDNQTAPFLEAGEHEAAARFPASITTNSQGKKLVEVQFFLVNVPGQCELRIYGEKSATEPGDLLYSADISAGVGPNGWNIHTLTTPIDITAEDIWIAVRVVHNTEINSIGCDFGPAQTNGDWIISAPSTSWQTFRDLTNQEANINWNIRGYVE